MTNGPTISGTTPEMNDNHMDKEIDVLFAEMIQMQQDYLNQDKALEILE